MQLILLHVLSLECRGPSQLRHIVRIACCSEATRLINFRF
jgi:hypothetical protein